MELALYCPVYGYYEKEKDTIGRRGDYYTSVSVGSLFGELLAFQFAEWLEEMPNAEHAAQRGQIVEAGAHDGRLAKDILNWLRTYRTEVFQRLEYWIIEPSARRQEWQRRTLADFHGLVFWARELSELASHSTGVRGIIFSNEFFDSMPVHRLAWDAKKRTWFEWGVTVQDGQFVWSSLSPAEGEGPGGGGRLREGQQENSALPIPEQMLNLLPDGFVVEACPAAEQWWRGAANVLEAGKLLTIDYGLVSDELLVPERTKGTLRAYHRHVASSDALAHPGEQDLTAHVIFSALQAVGESAGLKTESLLTQEQFLTRIAARVWKEENRFGKWTPEQARQFQTLTHPQHLGRLFRVLVQHQGS